MSPNTPGSRAGSDLWDTIREQLRVHGIDFDACCAPCEEGTVKVVCVAPNFKESLDELGRTPRGHNVMVRIDEETSRVLDAWVETGQVRSRSEAAAVFLREGIKIRAKELARLHELLREVEDARRRLRDKAVELLGDVGEPARTSGPHNPSEEKQ